MPLPPDYSPKPRALCTASHKVTPGRPPEINILECDIAQINPASARNLVTGGRASPVATLHSPETTDMLETIIVLLLILWVLGLVSSYTMGGLIHLLLVVAIVVIAVRVIQGRRI